MATLKEFKLESDVQEIQGQLDRLVSSLMNESTKYGSGRWRLVSGGWILNLLIKHELISGYEIDAAGRVTVHEKE